jgi:hypothetical protein
MTQHLTNRVIAPENSFGMTWEDLAKELHDVMDVPDDERIIAIEHDVWGLTVKTEKICNQITLKKDR